MSILSGCAPKSTTDSVALDIDKDLLYGNSNGNISNNGFTPEHKLNGYLYFTSVKEDPSNPTLVKANSESTSFELVTEDAAYYLNIYKEWIYYINRIDNHIYRIRYDGSNRNIVNNEICQSLLIVGDTMYYTVLSDNNYVLNSMHMDNSGKQELLKLDSPVFNFYNNTIYYWNACGSIYSYDLLSRKQKRIIDNVTDRFQVVDEFIYAVGTENQLYKCNEDGQQSQIINKVGKRFLVNDDYIYYIKPHNNQADFLNGNIYQSDLNGQNEIILDDSDIKNNNCILICDNVLYTFDGINSNFVMLSESPPA